MTTVNGRTMSEVFEDLLRNLQEMVRSEVRLAKTEIREEADKAKSAGLLVAIGAVLGLGALGAAVTAAGTALALVVPLWESALIVTVVLLIGAAVFLALGVKRFDNIHAVPQNAVDHLKGDIQWVKQHAK